MQPLSSLDHRLAQLERFYGVISAPPRDPFILFVWEVLSVQAIPRKREAALTALKRIPALTPDAMWKAPPAKLEAAVALAALSGAAAGSAAHGRAAVPAFSEAARDHPRDRCARLAAR